MNEKILIVDDEPTIRRLLRGMLESAGYACMSAAGGVEARERILQEPVDLVLADIYMPGELGTDLIRYLTAQYPDIAVMAVTAMDDPVKAEGILELGVYGYLLKPIDRGQLLISVMNALRRRTLEIERRSSLQTMERTIAERTGQLQETRVRLQHENQELSRLIQAVHGIKIEWETTMDCMTAMVILTDEQGIVRRSNRAFEEFARQSCREIKGSHLKDLLAEAGFEEEVEIKDHGELFHKPSARWFVVNASPTEAASTKSGQGYVITIHDTTQIKAMTEELRKKNDELQATQAQILQQEKMASIGQLAAGVAHEINNPIGFISSNLGTLARYVERIDGFLRQQDEIINISGAPEIHESISEIRKSLKIEYILGDINALIEESLDGANRVKKIVQDLKSFSRVDQAEYKYADINECMESTINIVWNELKYKATVKKDYGEIPLTKCYPQQLNQVFMNFLVNAAQAIEKQGDIEIRTRSIKGSIVVSVSDTGCGIPQKDLVKIFEPFFTTKEVGKGTGLGLSIAYDIVKKHNGEIEVESEMGKGTTIKVKIPVVEGRE